MTNKEKRKMLQELEDMSSKWFDVESEYFSMETKIRKITDELKNSTITKGDIDEFPAASEILEDY